MRGAGGHSYPSQLDEQDQLRPKDPVGSLAGLHSGSLGSFSTS